MNVEKLTESAARKLIGLDPTPPDGISPAIPRPDTNSGQWLAVQRKIARMWLQGYDIVEIMAKLGIKSKKTVLNYINVARKELTELNAHLIDDRIEEAVASLKLIQVQAWTSIENGAPSEKFLPTILKASETIAKIRGVLSEHVIHAGNIVHEIKLYDFTDNFPPPKTVEGEFTEPAKGLLPEGPTVQGEIENLHEDILPTYGTKEFLEVVESIKTPAASLESSNSGGLSVEGEESLENEVWEW